MVSEDYCEGSKTDGIRNSRRSIEECRIGVGSQNIYLLLILIIIRGIMPVYQISVKNPEDQRIDAVIKKRKDLSDVPRSEAVKTLLFERIEEVVGDKP